MPDRTNKPGRADGLTSDGILFVFEGPDGVGKSTMVAEVHRLLSAETSQPIKRLAFPGREPGTLGHHVYLLHHNPAQFGIDMITPASLQLLHVAAHLDAIDTLIRPSVQRGEIVLLDRYWWSTWVYGVTNGADLHTLRAMIDLERTHWGDLQPTALFLLRRGTTLRSDEESDVFERRSAVYAALMETERASTHTVIVDNDGAIDDAVAEILRVVRQSLPPAVKT